MPSFECARKVQGLVKSHFDEVHDGVVSLFDFACFGVKLVTVPIFPTMVLGVK